MKSKRASGILLHPTSLPGPDGIGDLGPEAFAWVNFLADAGCAYWQVLPLGPTGYGDSPYQCFSAFAGNPYLISPALLLDDNLLISDDLLDRPAFQNDKVDFGAVIPWKLTVLDRAFKRFADKKPKKLSAAYITFKQANADWLEDFALFMAIKEVYGSVAWSDWPQPLRLRDSAALETFKKTYGKFIEKHTFRQFLFFRQWQAVLDYAHSKGIQVIGDIPIFIAFDSADAWANPELFYLNKRGLPTVVAGVPPDYFSPTGQLWGNPLYRWNIHKKTGYQWWIKRVRAALSLFDMIRLDHFRGFAGYWEIPYGKPTAEIGRWVTGPGASLFKAIIKELGSLPIIAEDLGEITPDVIELREQFELPGMRIAQFGFSTDAHDPFLPHNYVERCVAYTGTHDNDTVHGWYATAPEAERDFCRRYLARSGDDIAWDLIRAVWASPASLVLAPMQDLLSLGTEARMNFPGKAMANWTWRLLPGQINRSLQDRLEETNTLFSRNQNLPPVANKGHQ
jgi:4-alpha-glucanotransferase